MKILILEDEKVAARRLKRLVEASLPQAEILLFTELEEAREHFEETMPDLLFLDLNLNGCDGFEILHEVVEFPFDTIVVSANTDRAIEAFELGVIDFVPKPYEQDRIQKALNRFTGRLTRRHGASTLVVKHQGNRHFIPVSEVVYISGAGDYTELHCKDGRIHLHNHSLDKFERILPKRFVRIHKSYIVDIELVSATKVHGGGKYCAMLQHGDMPSVELPVSRNRYKELFVKE